MYPSCQFTKRQYLHYISIFVVHNEPNYINRVFVDIKILWIIIYTSIIPNDSSFHSQLTASSAILLYTSGRIHSLVGLFSKCSPTEHWDSLTNTPMTFKPDTNFPTKHLKRWAFMVTIRLCVCVTITTNKHCNGKYIRRESYLKKDV